MCTGVEIASLAAAAASAGAGAAGTYSAAKANKMDIESRDAAQRADRFRQAELQRQADADLRNEVTKFEPTTTQQQVDAAAATRVAGVAPAPAAAPAQYQSTTAVAPVEVKADLDRRLGNVATKAQSEAARRARLGAYGDVSVDQGMQIGRLGERFRQSRADSRGSTNVMNAEVGVPNSASPGWRNRSDLANTIGQIGSLYSIYGGQQKPPAERTDRIW